ncbi:hypothetical protein MLD38_002683 [Melastoma candidum]|uniref:Uncharacterized protein n=1 Tax=Melastoma candidum TaxID=119954 RepID=A0ACB9S1F6_9MYRT|nr:hypothetical protein MLD38_002683 [Melastoma candidum]
MKKHGPRSGSSCAACKMLKRRCTSNCVFAPYFRSDEPKKFAKVHKVFGASNVSKILFEVPEEQREETVNSLAYEAEARLSDPVYGCLGAITLLQRKMAELQHDLAIARARLARCNAAGSMMPSFNEGVAPADFGGLPFTSFTGPTTNTTTTTTESFGQGGFPDFGSPAMSDFDQYPYRY